MPMSTYLISKIQLRVRLVVERTAAQAIKGLALTAANYDNVIQLLQGHFGNKQQIISRHMEILLDTQPLWHKFTEAPVW